MTSISSFLMASTLLLWANSRAASRRPALVHFLTATMLAVSVAVLFFGVSPSVLGTMGRNPTLTDRTEVWSVCLSLVQNPVLGTGFESFWLGPRLEKMWSMYWWRPNEAHNGYLEIFLNLGWVGVAWLVVIIATGYRRVFRVWRRQPRAGIFLHGAGLQLYGGSVLADDGSSLDIFPFRHDQSPRSSKPQDPGNFRL